MANKYKYPIPAVIQIIPKEKYLDGKWFLPLGSDLSRYGYAHDEPNDLRRNVENPDILELICTFVNEEASKIWTKDERIRYSYLTRTKKRPKVIRSRGIIHEIDNERICECKNHPFLLLSGNVLFETSPVICGECLCPIPGYMLPDSIDPISWNRLNRYLEMIWLESGAYEEWARNQLEDFNSELNQEARKITSLLRKHYKVPVYFRIWTYFEDDNSRKRCCPNCGAKDKKSSWARPQYICNRCKLTFDY